MTKKGQIWKCEICGNIIQVLHEGADSLVCCGKPMVLQEAHLKDPEKGEKHIPLIERNKVKVGSVEHPMDEKHYIEWIEATDGSQIAIVFLSPGEKPEAEFCFKPIASRIYCNIHGLWSNK